MVANLLPLLLTAFIAVPWPASYRGRGIWIEPLADGWFMGLVEGGYHSAPYPDAQQALADVTAWIDRADGVSANGEVSA